MRVLLHELAQGGDFVRRFWAPATLAPSTTTTTTTTMKTTAASTFPDGNSSDLSSFHGSAREHSTGILLRTPVVTARRV